MEEDAAEAYSAVQQPEPHSTVPDWSAAVTACLTAAGASGLLSSLLVVPMNNLFMVWALAGAALAVSLYERRTRHGTISGRLGARLGFVTGMLAGCAMLLFSAAFLLLQRFAFGNGWKIDRYLTTGIEQMVRTTPAEAQAQLTRLFTIPDWRAGLTLMYGVMLMAFMVVFAMVGGALGGKYYALKHRFQQTRR